MPEGRGSDARRLDLTKDQRDEHIRRYAELLEARAAVEIQVPQTAAPEIGYRQPPPQTKGIPRQIAEETGLRSEEHTSELQSLMRISYAVFCLKKKIKKHTQKKSRKK